MNLSEKIETITGKRDSLARRVLNTAESKVANISAEELAEGVTLEALEALNVPVYRYDTQVTIHGKIPGATAGNRLFTLNGNGSVGVRYAAIDAEKKRTLHRACTLSGKKWVVNSDSQGFTLSRMFAVRSEEERAQVKAECLTALREVPSSLFYGWAGAFALSWGRGYAVQVSIGAIPAENVAALVKFFSGFQSMEELNLAEAVEIAKRDAERAEREARWEREAIERKAEAQAVAVEFSAFLEAVTLPKLSSVKRAPGSFSFYSKNKDASGAFILKTVKIAKRGPFLCFKVEPSPSYCDKFAKVSETKWKVWEEAAEKGLIYAAPVAV